MTIGEIIKYKDINTYKRLKKLCKTSNSKSSEIKLGDSIENLMQSNGYTREGRRIKQKTWS